MSLRCRPGDLAVFVKVGAEVELLGRFVSVLHMAPEQDFTMPDGFMHEGSPGRWFVRLVGSPIRVPKVGGGRGNRLTCYLTAPDHCLRPIRPQSDPETVTRDTEVTA